MKRIHVHVSVTDLDHSLRFYSALFATPPTVVKDDYAKWMLDDPRVNFAISARGAAPGVEHLGIQAEDESELAEVFTRLSAAEGPVLAEPDATCCYARSEKQWIADPSGVAWETFWTHGESTTYGQGGAIERLAEAEATACCTPSALAPPRAAATPPPAPPPALQDAACCAAPVAPRAAAPCCVPHAGQPA
ncbi:ArsI/CadI family heavy metal resistance metalloenzyme [Roseomonas sp. CCTCC AB2023176]|uniref:ArsI/CadI family heavy metal resistance metalloenzyme n=1 Tax=Roseomonas sp. CCTCC AB2023176 TaxID=3342640 RepID=UPI0035E1687E